MKYKIISMEVAPVYTPSPYQLKGKSIFDLLSTDEGVSTIYRDGSLFHLWVASHYPDLDPGKAKILSVRLEAKGKELQTSKSRLRGDEVFEIIENSTLDEAIVLIPAMCRLIIVGNSNGVPRDSLTCNKESVEVLLRYVEDLLKPNDFVKCGEPQYYKYRLIQFWFSMASLLSERSLFPIITGTRIQPNSILSRGTDDTVSVDDYDFFERNYRLVSTLLAVISEFEMDSCFLRRMVSFLFINTSQGLLPNNQMLAGVLYPYRLEQVAQLLASRLAYISFRRNDVSREAYYLQACQHYCMALPNTPDVEIGGLNIAIESVLNAEALVQLVGEENEWQSALDRHLRRLAHTGGRGSFSWDIQVYVGLLQKLSMAPIYERFMRGLIRIVKFQVHFSLKYPDVFGKSMEDISKFVNDFNNIDFLLKSKLQGTQPRRKKHRKKSRSAVVQEVREKAKRREAEEAKRRKAEAKKPQQHGKERGGATVNGASLSPSGSSAYLPHYEGDQEARSDTARAKEKAKQCIEREARRQQAKNAKNHTERGGEEQGEEAAVVQAICEKARVPKLQGHDRDIYTCFWESPTPHIKRKDALRLLANLGARIEPGKGTHIKVTLCCLGGHELLVQDACLEDRDFVDPAKGSASWTLTKSETLLPYQVEGIRKLLEHSGYTSDSYCELEDSD